MKEEAIVAQEGFEPSIPKGRGILSPLCMPVPPQEHYVGTQRIELCSKDFQSSAMSPDLPSTHIDLFASLPASPSISQGQ